MRAVVHAPASIVVGIIYSKGVSLVNSGIRYSSFTLNRPIDKECVIICTGLLVILPCTMCSEFVNHKLPCLIQTF